MILRVCALFILSLTAMAGNPFKNGGPSLTWKNGILPISFDITINQTQIKNFFDACEIWSRRTPIRCVRKKRRHKKYIFLTRKHHKGCRSDLGAGTGKVGVRKMNLATQCWNQRTILHEIGHALGLTHEHQRYDRDAYIDVVEENIKLRYRPQFNRLQKDQRLNFAYDFNSIMHYARRNGASVDGKPTFFIRENLEDSSMVGKKITPSDFDFQKIKTLYQN